MDEDRRRLVDIERKIALVGDKIEKLKANPFGHTVMVNKDVLALWEVFRDTLVQEWALISEDNIRNQAG